MANSDGDGTTRADVNIKKARFFDSLFNHPAGFWFIFWGEFAERCSYYGMLSILPRYMSEQMTLGEANAGTNVSLFKAACYFLPLLGGFLADVFFGKYWIIVGFSIPYILGHVILGYETPLAMFIALALLAMGSGVIKPNISTLMGLTYDQKRPGEDTLRSNAFSIFYMAINIGAMLAYAFIPMIRTGHSYWLAFLVPAFLMALAFTIFAAGKPFYAVEVISSRQTTPDEWWEKLMVILRVAPLFVPIIFFWAVFDQSHTTWVFFARTYTDCELLGVQFDPEQFGVLNPFLIIAFVPLTMLFFSFLSSRGIIVRPTQKLFFGFVLTAVTMGVTSLSGYLAGASEMRQAVGKDGELRVSQDGSPVMERYVPPEERVTIWWQVFSFVLLTMSEVLISVTGLELAFVIAPKSMKSFITAMFLATVGVANLCINAPVTRLYAYIEPGNYFMILTVMMVVVAIAFIFVARWFERQTAASRPALPGDEPIPQLNGEPDTRIKGVDSRISQGP